MRELLRPPPNPYLPSHHPVPPKLVLESRRSTKFLFYIHKRRESSLSGSSVRVPFLESHLILSEVCPICIESGPSFQTCSIEDRTKIKDVDLKIPMFVARILRVPENLLILNPRICERTQTENSYEYKPRRYSLRENRKFVWLN